MVNTALLHYGLPKDLVMKFDSTINETSATHLLSMEEENELNAALFSETFHQQLNETLNRYLKKQQLLLKICDDLEDLFHPLLLFKVYLNRLYFCLELFCVLYVSVRLRGVAKKQKTRIFRRVPPHFLRCSSSCTPSPLWCNCFCRHFSGKSFKIK